MDLKTIIAALIKQFLPQIEDQAAKVLSVPVEQVQVAVTGPANVEAQLVALPMKKLTLKRDLFRDDGIFSTLLDGDKVIAHTCEHSYDKKPKLFNGTFTCVRGPHRLHGMTADFSTFEIMGVTGHTGVLWHWGNFNKDSDGCVLLGEDMVIEKSPNGVAMVTNSKATFAKFMEMFVGVDQFELEVI